MLKECRQPLSRAAGLEGSLESRSPPVLDAEVVLRLILQAFGRLGDSVPSIPILSMLNPAVAVNGRGQGGVNGVVAMLLEFHLWVVVVCATPQAEIASVHSELIRGASELSFS